MDPRLEGRRTSRIRDQPAGLGVADEILTVKLGNNRRELLLVLLGFLEFAIDLGYMVLKLELVLVQIGARMHHAPLGLEGFYFVRQVLNLLFLNPNLLVVFFVHPLHLVLEEEFQALVFGF